MTSATSSTSWSRRESEADCRYARRSGMLEQSPSGPTVVGATSLTLPRLKPVGFSVQPDVPAVAGLTVCPQAFLPSPVSRGDGTTRAVSQRFAQDSERCLVLTTQRFLFLQGFPPGRVFSRQPATLSFQRAIPEGMCASIAWSVGSFKITRLHPTSEWCGLSVRFL